MEVVISRKDDYFCAVFNAIQLDPVDANNPEGNFSSCRKIKQERMSIGNSILETVRFEKIGSTLRKTAGWIDEIGDQLVTHRITAM